MRFGLALLVILSGFASLTFQVAWARLIGLSIGSSSTSVSAVVTAFFGGLSVGSLLAARLRRRYRGWDTYLMLELAIGLFGLMSLPVLLRLDGWVALLPELGGSLVFKFFVAVLLLLLPTACMGATFPVLVEVVVRKEAEAGRRVSELYSLNTLGAVFGAVLSGFVVIPSLGLDGAIQVAAGTNFAIVGLGWGMRRTFVQTSVASSKGSVVEGSAAASAVQPVAADRDDVLSYKALAVLAGTGFVSIVVEIAWTKFLVMFVGTTVYGFSTVLAVYLFGIAAGSWFARSRVDALRTPARWLALGLSLLGIALLLTRTGLGLVPLVQQTLDARQVPAVSSEGVRLGAVFLLLFPPTFLLGALFPLSLKLFQPRTMASRAGVAYGVNTLAGIVGSILAGLVWIPKSGTSAVLTATAVGVLLLPGLFYRELLRSRWLLGVSSCVLVGLGLAVVLPPLRLDPLIDSIRQDRFLTGSKKPRQLFLKEGKTGVVSASTTDDVTAILYDNGLRESVIHLKDPDYGLFMESMLGLYPYLLHPAPESAFVVGLGGGATMRALEFTKLRAIHVVELEEAVKDAVVALVGAERGGLEDPRLRLEINDARNALLLERSRYDLIVSQPSHPWRAGAGNVFTEEYFSLAASRLAEPGIYAHWVNLFRMDQATLKAIFRSFLAVFPNVICFVHQGTADLLLVGSASELRFDAERVAERMREPRVARFLKRWRMRHPSDLISLFGLSRAELVAATGPGIHSTDTNLVTEVRLGRSALDAELGEGPLRFLRKQATFDVLPYLDPRFAGPWLYELAKDFRKQQAGLVTYEQLVHQLTRVDPEAAQRLQVPAQPRAAE